MRLAMMLMVLSAGLVLSQAAAQSPELPVPSTTIEGNLLSDSLQALESSDRGP
ncbi:MAG: hypothetical protein ABFD16_27725 [Thermoguttaceae bacterium]|jgi:hypothetical protein